MTRANRILLLLLLVLLGTEVCHHGAGKKEAEFEVQLDLEGVGCGRMIVPVRLGSGEELPFILDTGSPVTLLDKSLKESLGKPIESMKIDMWKIKQRSKVYAAPRLYLGEALLMTGGTVGTFNFQNLPGAKQHRVMGIIGVDCLQNYCVEIDFAAGRIRFTKTPADDGRPGNRFDMVLSDVGQGRAGFYRTFIQHQGLVGGVSTNLLMIDTGLDLDGAITEELRVKGEKEGLQEVDKDKWLLQECEWACQSYTNVIVRSASGAKIGAGDNLLGLRFLSRHKVTLDFLGRSVYLEKQSSGPMENEISRVLDALVLSHEKLPDEVEEKLTRVINHKTAPFWFRLIGGTTLSFKKYGESDTFHYKVRRNRTGEGLWRLKKSWITNSKGETLKEFLIGE